MKLGRTTIRMGWGCILIAIFAFVAHAQQIANEEHAIATAYRLVSAVSHAPVTLVSAKAIFHSKPKPPDWLALMSPSDDDRFLSAVRGKKYWVVHLKLDENTSSEGLPVVWGTSIIIDAETGNEIFWHRK